MPSSIVHGSFVLHSSATPTLPAGPYKVHAEQRFTAPGATTTAFDSHLEVTAPRFGLPAGQILSTFPPNKSEGAFSARLPQIVLKRRTLPWERELDSKLATSALPRGIPWLALVVLADAECEFRSSVPVANCVTPGVTLEGRNDVTVGDAIVVTQTVVSKVFPTKEDLPLLAHVREVDLSDTELAMGDDDGWLAVVLSNRLPQGGVRYRACLISLEGQYDVLPDTAEVEPHPPDAFVSPFVYPIEAVAMMVALPAGTTTAPSNGAISIADSWSATASKTTRTKAGTVMDSGRRVNASHLGDMHVVPQELIDAMSPRYVFPVLANWQFTCTGDEDFQMLMQRLDVGLLDTVVRPPVTRRGEKPRPPRTHPEPQVVDTGHVRLSHVNRVGDTESVWYRGPFVPHPGGRDVPDAAGRLPLLHASDQARRIGPDGRENLSLAAAFEIGRLLALAAPSVIAAFLNWRKEGFEAARRMELAVGDIELGRVDVTTMMAGFAARMGNRLIVDLGANVGTRFGTLRPPIDGGCPIAGLDGLDVVQLIATGFGLPVEMVRCLIEPGAAAGVVVVVPVATQVIGMTELSTRTGAELGHLRDVGLASISNIARDSLRSGPGALPDALDALVNGGLL